ncbi:MAG: hypothetical protein R6U26_00295 [Candidatus Undinarchaeales archaeon]
MVNEISNGVLAVLLVVAIVVSLFGTYTVISKISAGPTEVTIPQSSDSGVVNVYVMPEPMDQEGQVTLNVVNNTSEEGTT